MIREIKEKLSIKDVRRQAAEEYKEEKLKEAKKKIKRKLKELHEAEIIVKNIKREIEDLELELEDELN